MRKIYFNGYLISLTDHDWFHDREGKWHHLVIQEQTQEPEMCNRCGFIHTKEDGCPKPTLKEPEMNGHWVVDQGGNKFWATDHKKEPECKHEYNSCANNERPFCGKCGRQFGDEKPAKKDELAERLHNAYLEACNDLHPESFNQKAQVPYEKLTMEQKFLDKACADEAREWAVEVVEKWSKEMNEPCEYLLARLKESK